MRSKIIAGNWKMNKEHESAAALTSDILRGVKQQGLDQHPDKLTILICPPSLFIAECLQAAGSDSSIHIGAQNCHSKASGAFTGEISAPMLKSIGVEFVIIGHSERRQYFAESHSFLNEKLLIVLEQGLKPIFCCGETIEDREAGKHFDLIKKQLEESLFSLDINDIQRVIIAYEPVWAIGTGLTASPAQAQEMHLFIRELLAGQYGQEIAAQIPLLYGGSCNASNAAVLLSQADVDGGLIGGASLKAEDFLSIARSAMELSNL